MYIDKVQKKKDFFEIREQLKKVEKYIDVVDVDNRFLELDFWMDDLLYLAREYCEGRLAQRVNHYKRCHRSERVMIACFSLRCVFEREGWELGILKKYRNYGMYEKNGRLTI